MLFILRLIFSPKGLQDAFNVGCFSLVTSAKQLFNPQLQLQLPNNANANFIAINEFTKSKPNRSSSRYRLGEEYFKVGSVPGVSFEDNIYSLEIETFDQDETEEVRLDFDARARRGPKKIFPSSRSNRPNSSHSKNNNQSGEPNKKNKKKKKEKIINDRFEQNCTQFEQIIFDGPDKTLKIPKNELCISISKIPKCHWNCKEQNNIKMKYRFACLDKNDPFQNNRTITNTNTIPLHIQKLIQIYPNFTIMEIIIFQVNTGKFIDLSRFYTRKLKTKFPSGCVQRVRF